MMREKIPVSIVDDEPGSIITLEALLKEYCPEVYVTGTALNAEDAIELFETTKPSLVFLDIEMPFANGFELLDRMKPVPFEVIFVTAFNNYALKAFKYAALDYLLKPINIDELKEAVCRAVRLLSATGRSNKRVETLLNNLEFPSDNPTKITVPTGSAYEVISLHEILYIQASGNFSLLVLEGGKSFIASKSLKEFEELLSTCGFYRAHHGHMLNLTKIRKFLKGKNGAAELLNGDILEVAVRKRAELLTKLKPL